MSNDIVLPQRQQVELQTTEGTAMKTNPVTITFDNFFALGCYIARNCTGEQYARALRKMMRMEIVG